MSVGEQGRRVKETEGEEKGMSAPGLASATGARSSLLFTVTEQNDRAPIRGNKPVGVIAEKNCVFKSFGLCRGQPGCFSAICQGWPQVQALNLSKEITRFSLERRRNGRKGEPVRLRAQRQNLRERSFLKVGSPE